MAFSSLSSKFTAAQGVAAHAAHMLSVTFLNPGSTFSLLSLGFALAIAAVFLSMRLARKARKRHSLKVLLRALFPRWLWRSASTRADAGFFALNLFATGALIGWALLSSNAIAHIITRALNNAFGALGPLPLSPLSRGAILTVALFLAYDFAYWVDHYLKHKIPALWEFHRVHHTAEVLSPLTNYRMHPVDSLIFSNIVSLGLGVVGGVGVYVLGGAQEMQLSGTNIVLLFFIFTTVHLQHSRIDIRFGGWLGKLIFSPAHHHIHHSMRREHFDSNLGSCLAIWDWMFGTLILPDAVKGRLKFGVDTEADRYTPHSTAGGLVWPFVRAFRTLLPRAPKPAPRLIRSAE